MQPYLFRTLVNGLLAATLLVPLSATAADSDRDALPDNWETDHGFNPSSMNYSISSMSQNTVNVCATGNCTTSVGIQFINTFVGYCSTVVDSQHGYRVSGQYTLQCDIAGIRSISCNMVYVTTVSQNGGVVGHYPTCNAHGKQSAYQTINTVADIGHFVSTPTRLCALTTRGVQCWGVDMSGEFSTILTLTPQGLLNYPIDPDEDGITSDLDLFPLDTTESIDTDLDSIGNNADKDDDGDGVPDYIDADPLNAAIVNERSLPIESGYKGSSVAETIAR